MILPGHTTKFDSLAEVLHNPAVPILAFTPALYQEINCLTAIMDTEWAVFLTLKRLSPAERLFFGWANLLGEDIYWELGSVSLEEMEALAITLSLSGVGLPLTEKQYTCRVTLDRYFKQTPISRIRELPPRCAQLHASAAARL